MPVNNNNKYSNKNTNKFSIWYLMLSKYLKNGNYYFIKSVLKITDRQITDRQLYIHYDNVY